MKKDRVYAVYKGDDFLQLGTVKELAKYFNVLENTIRYLSYPVNIKRADGKTKTGKDKKRKIAIIIEEEE